MSLQSKKRRKERRKQDREEKARVKRKKLDRLRNQIMGLEEKAWFNSTQSKLRYERE